MSTDLGSRGYFGVCRFPLWLSCPVTSHERHGVFARANDKENIKSGITGHLGESTNDPPVATWILLKKRQWHRKHFHTMTYM